MRQTWNRPQLPSEHSSSLIPIGWIMLLIALVCLTAIFATEFDSPLFQMALLNLSSAAAGLGMLLLMVGAVVNELRRTAFEAAIRAGETQDAKRPKLPKL